VKKGAYVMTILFGLSITSMQGYYSGASNYSAEAYESIKVCYVLDNALMSIEKYLSPIPVYSIISLLKLDYCKTGAAPKAVV